LTPLNCSAILHLHISNQIIFITRGGAAMLQRLTGEMAGHNAVGMAKESVSQPQIDRHFRLQSAPKRLAKNCILGVVNRV
jgi:hypothetical protein